MSSTPNVIMYVVFGVVLLSAFLFSYPRGAPNLLHPIRWRRWLHRVLAYPCCHFVASMIVLAILDGLSTYLPALELSSRRGTFWMWLQMVILPLPLALLFVKLGIWLQRVLLGYEHRPPAAPAAPLPPAWVPPPPRRNDYSGLDLHDTELVRELARSHWRVAHEALEQGTSTALAEDLHRSFLQDHLGTVESGLANRARTVYCDEMARQAHAAQINAERIEALRERQLQVLSGEIEVKA